MADCFQSNSHEAGVTLTELLVVIVLISVLGAYALLQRGAASEQLARQNTAQQLKTAFERARFDSVKRRAECDAKKAKVEVNADSFVLWTDKDMSGTPDAAEVETIDFAGRNISIAGIGVAIPVTVSFNQRGEVIANDGITTSAFPGIVICNGTCPDPLTDSLSNKVYVTPTGTVNLMGGAQTPPTFGTHGGTTIGTGEEINDNMLLSTSTGGC